MSMIKCKECKQEVSSAAKACPHCGAAEPALTMGGKLAGCGITVAIFVSACFGLGTWLTSGGDNWVEVTAAEFGDKWPLTVEKAELTCESPSSVLVRVDGVTYAVTSAARSQVGTRDWKDVTEISRVDPAAVAYGKKWKISSEPLADRGLPMCAQ